MSRSVPTISDPSSTGEKSRESVLRISVNHLVAGFAGLAGKRHGSGCRLAARGADFHRNTRNAAWLAAMVSIMTETILIILAFLAVLLSIIRVLYMIFIK